MDSLGYRFSFGPWNISDGADPSGPDVRQPYPHEAKYALYKKLGFDGVQFHDDDDVPGLDDLSAGNVAGEGVLRAEGDLEAAVASLTGQSRASNRLSGKKMPETSPGARRGGARC